MAEPIRFDELDGEAEEAPGVVRTFYRHMRQGLNPLWDEGAGVVGAGFDSLQHLRDTGSVVTPKEWLGHYRANRDESRLTDTQGAQANPTAATAGKVTGIVGGGVLAGGAGGVGSGLARAVTSGATQGALHELASSEEDLTYQDARAYARAFGDALKGGAAGAAGGGVGYGVVAGLRKVGDKASGVLGRARRELLDEARGARAVEDEALVEADAAAQRKLAIQQQDAQKMDRARAREVAREKMAAERAARVDANSQARAAREAEAAAVKEARAAQAEAERLERAHGQALEQNKRVEAARAAQAARDARAAQRSAEARAKEAQRAAERMEREQGRAMEENKRRDAKAPGQPAPGSPATPATPTARSEDTDVLMGYRGAAGRRWADNDPKVRGFMEELKNPDLPPARRQKLERYLEGHGDVFNDPAAFERRIMQEEMRRAGYTPEQVERIMRERVTPELEVRSRRAAPEAAPAPRAPAELPEHTQVPEPADWLKRGHRPEEVIRQGGGGSALDGLQEAPTRVDARMQPDPFHDAPTRAGLVQIGVEEPDRVGDALRRKFSFTDRNTGREYNLTAYESPHDPKVIVIGGVGEVGQDFIGSWGQNANSMGPQAMRELLRELARQFPGAERVGGFRVTGISPNRGMNVRLPEVTQAGTPDFPEVPPFRDYQPPPERTLPFGQDVDLPPLREPTAPSARALGARDVPRAEPEVLPDLEDLTQPGAPFPEGVQRYDVLGQRPTPRAGQPYRAYGAPRRSALPPEEVAAAEEAMAARRAAAAGAEVGMGGRAPLPPEPTAGARPRAMPAEASNSMRAPVDEATLPPEPTRATSVPEVRRPVRPAPERVRVVDRGGQTRLGEAPLDVRMQARPSPEDVVDQRMARGGQDLLDAFVKGASGDGAAAFGVGGLMLGGLDGGLAGIAAKGGMAAVREALKNPAARARAISAFKMDRLARLRPDVWGRVGAALARAMEKGPEKYAAARHAYLLRDPEFRAADAEVAKELAGLDDEALAERLKGAAGAAWE